MKAWLAGHCQKLVEVYVAATTCFVLGVVLGGGFVFYLHHSHHLGGSPPRPIAASSPVKVDQARELAARFRPWLKLDGAERWRPLNLDHLFHERFDGAPAHQLCTGAAKAQHCVGVGSADALTALVHNDSTFGGSHLDLAGTALEDYRGDACGKAAADCGRAPGSAIYYHVTKSNDRFYIDFWWFFRFNDFYRSQPSVVCHRPEAIAAGICDQHEGDWEGVTVVTPPDRDDKVDYVVYAAHKGTFRYAASELQLEGGTHPDVYVARGSHASYPVACTGECTQPIALAAIGLVSLPEGRFDGKVDWERDHDADCDAGPPAESCLQELPRTELDPRAWTVWPGQWGAGCAAACGGLPGVSSPQSPGLQQRFQTPHCSSQGAVQTCDGRALNCGDWLGPLVAVVACDAERLATGLAATGRAKAVGGLTITAHDGAVTYESTPGVVQALDDPLQAPDATTIVGNATTRTQILVRARQGDEVVEARFTHVTPGPGGRVVLTVQPNASEWRVVVLDGQPPDELRVIRLPQADGRPGAVTAG